MSNSSVYNMYLSTIIQDFPNVYDPPIAPTNKTRITNTTWSINWNNLFKNNNINRKYKHCRVRYDLRTANFSQTIATGTAYQSGTTLTVVSISGGTLAPLATITISTTTENIVSIGTALSGTTGTYIMNTSATIGSIGSPVAFTATTNWNLATGYLACNLESSNSLSANENGVVLGLLTPSLSPIVGSTNFVYNSSTIQDKGIDIVIPQGTQPFTLSFINLSTGQLMQEPTSFNYEIMLYFELYN